MLYAPPAHARRARDAYATPPELVSALIRGLAEAGLSLPTPVHDPCAGGGALLGVLGGSRFGSDLYPELYPRHMRIWPEPIDAKDPEAVASVLGVSRSIVTNPPYGRDAQAIVEAAVSLVEAGQVDLAAFLLPLPWEAAGSRLALIRKLHLRIVCTWRPEWIPGTGGGGKMNSAWLVWTRQPPTFPISVYVGRP